MQIFSSEQVCGDENTHIHIIGTKESSVLTDKEYIMNKHMLPPILFIIKTTPSPYSSICLSTNTELRQQHGYESACPARQDLFYYVTTMKQFHLLWA